MEEFVSYFVAWLVERKRAFGTIKVYLFGVAAYYKDLSLGCFNPCDSFLVQQTLAGARNILASVPKSKFAFYLDFLRAFKPLMDLTSYVDARDWAAFLVGFFGLLRKSELLALVWGNIIEVDGGFKILIAVSKTTNHAVFVHIASRDDELCPLRALKALRDLLPQDLRKDKLPIFSSSIKSKGSNKALTGSAFVKRIKKWVEAIGLDPTDFSGHSLRRGGATALLRAGVAAHDIQVQGRWASECWKIYTERSTAQLISILASI